MAQTTAMTMSPIRFFNDVLASVMFLSRLPLPRSFHSDDLPDFGKTAYTYPVAGALIALPAALLTALAFWLGLSPTVSALIAVATLVIVTGALHEDGLADVTDGFWGGHTKDRKLEIMRDSAIGTYGVLALVLMIALKMALLAQLFGTLSWVQACVLIVVAAAFSRTAMLTPWVMLPPARPKTSSQITDGKEESGLSIRYGAPDFKTLTTASLLAAPSLLALYLADFSLVSMIVSLTFMKVLLWLFTALAKHHIGGHTGDVLGASQQISELGLLLGLAIAI